MSLNISTPLYTRQRSNTVPSKPREIIHIINNKNNSPLENTPNNTPSTPHFKPINKISSAKNMKRQSIMIDDYELPPPSVKVYDQSKMLFLKS